MEDFMLDSIIKKIVYGETLLRFERDWFSINLMFNREWLMKCMRFHFKEKDAHKFKINYAYKK